MHAGFEQLHVHHLHGGGTRWRLNPGADDTDLDAGLLKTPIQNAKSIRLDSQTVSPLESYNLEHECGAGGCQQAEWTRGGSERRCRYSGRLRHGAVSAALRYFAVRPS